MRYRLTMVVSLCIAVVTVTCHAAGDAADVLPKPVAKLLSRARIPMDSLSIYVQPVDGDAPLLAFNPDVARNPASTIKLLTTFVALDELTPAYKWKTEAYVTGAVENGVLDGDLYLKGYGDPYMVTEYFWRLLRGLRKSGLQHIRGDLVLDNSYFRPQPADPAEFDGQPHRSYNVSPAALLLNFQSINFRLRPEPRQDRVAVIADPNPGIAVDNRLKLSRGRCRPWGVSMQILDGSEGDTVRFSGRYAEQCGERSLYRVIGDQADYVFGVFKNLWEEQNGQIDGALRQASVPDGARLYYTAESLPLSDIIRGINKYSNNVMTRQVLLTLGAERRGPPGTEAKGIDVLQQWLHDHDMIFPELVLDNGAGLSREVRISSRHLAQLLVYAFRSPYMPEFVSSLPVASQDGTLRKRLADSALEGRVHVKTGLLDDVRAMAGYVLDRHGRRVVIVALHNHVRAPSRIGQDVQDALLEWVYRRD